MLLYEHTQDVKNKIYMALFKQFDLLKQPSYKIELHVHLESTVRLTTLWELAQKKGISLGVKSLEDLYDKCSVKQPSTLRHYLEPFRLIHPVFCGDLYAIERLAYEFCEDSAKMGVLYTEPRYLPHLFCPKYCKINDTNASNNAGEITLENVVEAVNRGLNRGEKDFNLMARTILCCFRPHPEWSQKILDLCVKFRDEGVVGMDICFDEAIGMATPEDIAVFQKAAKLGVHRTAHAGEAGPPSNIAMAVEQMKVDRIGHGYHVLEDESLYVACLKSGIHFETCPFSSFLTGAVPLTTSKHPIVRFAEDNANFSISRDDPFIVQKTLDEEYILLKRMGLKEVHFARANFNAANSCFLPDVDKQKLLLKLKQIYGIETYKEKAGNIAQFHNNDICC